MMNISWKKSFANTIGRYFVIRLLGYFVVTTDQGYFNLGTYFKVTKSRSNELTIIVSCGRIWRF